MIAAVVPAAGRSERMGRPKLILTVGGVTVIARVVKALRHGGADPVIVVAPPAEEPGAALLAEHARNAGALVVVAERVPPDMRASVELGLGRLGAVGSPRTVLLVPGDSPAITPDLVAQVVNGSRGNPDRIIVPVVTGKRGHPVALPWRLASEIPHLPPGIGVNALVKSRAADVVELEVDDLGAVADLDTPEDYQRWAVSPPKGRPCQLRWSGEVDGEEVHDDQGHDQNQVSLPRDVQENDGQRDHEAHPVGQE